MQTYAQVNEAGVCVGLLQVELAAGPPQFGANMVEVAAMDTSLIGRTYSAGTWSAAPTPGAPTEVTMRQARLALLGAGHLSAVEAAINALAEPAKTVARIEWDYSNTLQRANPLVAQLATALGLTSEQVDALFTAAAAL